MAVEPDFRKITDVDLIGLVAYCEKWSPKKVYDIAYAQVFPEKQLKDSKEDFIEWATVEQKLPPIVREELIRAARINFESGRMNKLKVYAQLRELMRKWGFWVFVLLVIFWWL